MSCSLLSPDLLCTVVPLTFQTIVSLLFVLVLNIQAPDALQHSALVCSRWEVFSSGWDTRRFAGSCLGDDLL